MAEIGLRPLVERLRDELAAASRDAERSDLRFTIDKVTVEIGFEVAVDLQAGGKIKFLVFEAGGEAARNTANSHKITLDMTPHRVTPEGRQDIDISDGEFSEPE